jgi:hypothetical protein
MNTRRSSARAGAGPKARLRFNLVEVDEWLTACSDGREVILEEFGSASRSAPPAFGVIGHKRRAAAHSRRLGALGGVVNADPHPNAGPASAKGALSVSRRGHRRSGSEAQHSLLDVAALMATAQKQNWALVALDCAIDTSTPAGEAMPHVLATFGQFERRLISQCTREALAAKKASGVRLGRPPSLPQPVVRRMQRLRSRGLSLRAIAENLNDAGVPTAQGGKPWYGDVSAVLLRTT